MGVPARVRKAAISVADRLIKADPLGKTKFETSFKVSNNRIPPKIRFLNMDSNAYSCKSGALFLERLKLYRGLMAGKTRNPSLPDLMEALAAIFRTPMDLYFGADIDGRGFLFAFWLIFGGVKRDGSISFWRYDFEKIIRGALDRIGLKGPGRIRKDILNLGFDISDKDIFYKIYFLCRERVLPRSNFTGLMRSINQRFSAFRSFYFISQMYDKNGECVKEKLFTEFLEDIRPGSRKMRELLGGALKISGSKMPAEALSEVIDSISGRVSLISFENDGTMTFYIRENRVAEAGC